MERRLLTKHKIDERLDRMAGHPLMKTVEHLEKEALMRILVAQETRGLTQRLNLWQTEKLFAEIIKLRSRIEKETT